MRSFILEYIERDEEDSGKDVSIDLHINLWSFQNKKPIFDLGFMIYNIKFVKEIILYVPFVVENVEDLGNIIKQSDILIEAIFNERCEVTTNFHPKRLKIIKKGEYDSKKTSEKDNEEKFIFYLLNEKQICNENYENYSKIKIDVSEILDKKESTIINEDIFKYYFRIRFSPKDKNISMIKHENEKINILQDSSLRTTEIIDFRINDLRSCPDQLREEFLKRARFTIEKIHYFIIRNSTDEFVGVDSSKVRSRILEKEIWKNYIEDIDKNDMIAYHVKEKDITSFLNLSRYKYPLNVTKRIILYLIFIMVISILSSFIFEKLKRFVI